MNTILPYFRLNSDSLWKNLPEQDRPLNIRPAETVQRSLHSKFKKDVGFYDWPEKISPEELQQIAAVAKDLRTNFDGAVIFGIGGSYLGPATIVDSLTETGTNPFSLHWLSNSDAPEIRRIEKAISGKRYAAIVISKSGGTVETLSAFFHLHHHFDPKGIVVITDPEKGELRRLSQQQKWRSFPVPPSIGGRFSVLTAVGLLPAALAGLSSEGLIAGATKMRQALESTQPNTNPALKLAEAFFLWDRGYGKKVHVLMPYEKRLQLFADWWVQLFGESLGKKRLGDPNEAVGFTPVAALGTTDQHSMLQLFKEGPSDKLVGFLSVYNKETPLALKKPNFEVQGFDYLFKHSFDAISHHACLATQQSLSNSQTPTYRIEFQRLDEPTLGALFFFFETVCGYAGEFYDVDAFNQPGVEETKKLLKLSLSQ